MEPKVELDRVRLYSQIMRFREALYRLMPLGETMPTCAYVNAKTRNEVLRSMDMADPALLVHYPSSRFSVDRNAEFYLWGVPVRIDNSLKDAQIVLGLAFDLQWNAVHPEPS